MTKDYLRDSKGRFVKGTPQPVGFGKGKQKTPWNYHGGGVELDKGYLRIYIDGKREYAHRYIWRQVYGAIPKGCVIHHINGDKLNNAIDNLECVTISEHNKIHNIGSV